MIRQSISFLLKHTLKSNIIKKLPTSLSYNMRQMKQVRLFSQKKQQATQTPVGSLGQSQPPKKKLTQMQFDDLIEMKTQQSLAVAEAKVQQFEKKVQDNHSKLKLMVQQMEYLQKHAEQTKQKELKLIENIETQQAQLKRVKARAEKQVDDSKKYSVTKLAKQLLEAADCINRCKNEAVKQYPNAKDPFILGIIQTQKQLVDILKGFQIEEFDPIGKQFDPNTQESLLQIPCYPGCTPNTVATTMRTGYLIKGRLLRSARVGIFQ